jgi:hypothetical protein
LQQELLRQGAYLRPSQEKAATLAGAQACA